MIGDAVSISIQSPRENGRRLSPVGGVDNNAQTPGPVTFAFTGLTRMPVFKPGDSDTPSPCNDSVSYAASDEQLSKSGDFCILSPTTTPLVASIDDEQKSGSRLDTPVVLSPVHGNADLLRDLEFQSKSRSVALSEPALTVRPRGASSYSTQRSPQNLALPTSQRVEISATPEFDNVLRLSQASSTSSGKNPRRTTLSFAFDAQRGRSKSALSASTASQLRPEIATRSLPPPRRSSPSSKEHRSGDSSGVLMQCIIHGGPQGPFEVTIAGNALMSELFARIEDALPNSSNVVGVALKGSPFSVLCNQGKGTSVLDYLATRNNVPVVRLTDCNSQCSASYPRTTVHFELITGGRTLTDKTGGIPSSSLSAGDDSRDAVSSLFRSTLSDAKVCQQRHSRRSVISSTALMSRVFYQRDLGDSTASRIALPGQKHTTAANTGVQSRSTGVCPPTQGAQVQMLPISATLRVSSTSNPCMSEVSYNSMISSIADDIDEGDCPNTVLTVNSKTTGPYHENNTPSNEEALFSPTKLVRRHQSFRRSAGDPSVSVPVANLHPFDSKAPFFSSKKVKRRQPHASDPGSPTSLSSHMTKYTIPEETACGAVGIHPPHREVRSCLGRRTYVPKDETEHKRLNFYTKEVALTEQSNVYIGQFTIVRTIGIGCAGHVVHARRFGVDLALKIISMSHLRSAKRYEAVIRERSLLAACNSPFIIRIHNAFETPSHLLLALEFMSGGDLHHHCLTRGAFSNDDALFYAAEISLGLDYLHYNDMIYRDLKPDNVLLDTQGHSKLTDFGLAREIPQNTRRLTSFVGTEGYIAPEVADGSGYGIAYDYYMFGCVIYVLLSGDFPTAQRGHTSLLQQSLESNNTKYPEYFSLDAALLLRKLLRKDKEKRLADWEKLRKQPWFKDVPWGLVYDHKWRTPPINPAANTERGVSNFPEHLSSIVLSKRLDRFPGMIATGDGHLHCEGFKTFKG